MTQIIFGTIPHAEKNGELFFFTIPTSFEWLGDLYAEAISELLDTID